MGDIWTPSAKRMRVDAHSWEPPSLQYSLKSSLFPKAAAGILQQSHELRGTSVGFQIPSWTIYSPRNIQSANGPRQPFRVSTLTRVSPSASREQLDVVVRPSPFTSPDEMYVEIATLRKEVEKQKEISSRAMEKVAKQNEFCTGAMEALEREHAEKVKAQRSLEEYKKMVNMRMQLRNENDPARQIGEDDKRRSDLRQGPSYLPTENPRSIPSSSISSEPQVSVPRISNAATLADEKNIQGGSEKWRELLEDTRSPTRTHREKTIALEIEYNLTKLRALEISRKKFLKKPEVDKTLAEAFTPLSAEAESDVEKALGGSDRYEVLAMHEKSNIDVTRIVMQCLLPGAWLNDEVINVYMELLKERELREPERFLKCHFFNTFFYNKLFKDKRSYDYKAVRRWTTQKKLGYSLSDCDKILVPIHQDIHWCLAVINIRDQKLEYLDSLKGADDAVLNVLARYIGDEVKDKDGKALDVTAWEHNFPKDIPEQLNGCDCGMFMVKYADFHSRGAPLSFTQDNMDYFRRKMVWEILRLRAI